MYLGNPKLSPAALKALLIWLYTERLDVAIEEVEPLLAVMRRCRLRHMSACILKERRTLRYYFKSTRKDEAGPRRWACQADSAHSDSFASCPTNAAAGFVSQVQVQLEAQSPVRSQQAAHLMLLLPTCTEEAWPPR